MRLARADLFGNSSVLLFRSLKTRWCSPGGPKAARRSLTGAFARDLLKSLARAYWSRLPLFHGLKKFISGVRIYPEK